MKLKRETFIVFVRPCRADAIPKGCAVIFADDVGNEAGKFLFWLLAHDGAFRWWAGSSQPMTANCVREKSEAHRRGTGNTGAKPWRGPPVAPRALEGMVIELAGVRPAESLNKTADMGISGSFSGY